MTTSTISRSSTGTVRRTGWRALAGVAVAGAVLAGGLAPTSASAATAGVEPSQMIATISDTKVVTGERVYIRAVVKPVNVSVPPTGILTFLDNGVSLGQVALERVKGQQVARLTTSLRVGTHPVSVRYDGDATFAGSASTPVDVVVTKATTRTVVTATPTKRAGEVAIAGVAKTVLPGRGQGTGTATFVVDGGAPQVLPVNADSRARLLVALKPGQHTVKVVYSGDADYRRSTASLTFTSS